MEKALRLFEFPLPELHPIDDIPWRQVVQVPTRGLKADMFQLLLDDRYRDAFHHHFVGVGVPQSMVMNALVDPALVASLGRRVLTYEGLRGRPCRVQNNGGRKPIPRLRRVSAHLATTETAVGSMPIIRRLSPFP